MMSDPLRTEPLKIALTVWDSENHKHTIYFGFHPGATYGFDRMFGEMPIPPVPSVPAFDVRFLDPFRKKQFPGNGAYIDIRQFASRDQADTFFVRGQPANDSFPLTFSWSEGLGTTFDTILLRHYENGSTYVIDMTKQTTFVLTGGEINTFEIITFGLKGKLPWTIP